MGKVIKCECLFYTLVLLNVYCGIVYARSTEDAGKLHSNSSQVLMQTTRRSDREILDEQLGDEFPVVHDFFYESEEEEYEEKNNHRDYSDDFEPLCQNVRRRIEMRSDLYEYHPPYYVETACRKFTSSGLEELSRSTFNQMCSQQGFSCVQRTRTLFLTRKRYDSDCWESTKEVVASGCDCMWPGRSHRNRRN